MLLEKKGNREKGMLIIMLQRKGNVNNYVIEKGKKEC